MPRLRIDLDVDDIVKRYLAGETEQGIAQTLGVTRDAIRRRLLRQGIEPRGASAANRIRMQRMTANQRQELAAAAHAAVRGSTQTDLHRSKRALTVGGRVNRWTSPYETQVADHLRARGWDVQVQHPAGRYNIDIACGSVAIEVHRATSHPYTIATVIQRTEYLSKHDWHVLYVWLNYRLAIPILPRCSDKIVALLELAKTDPAMFGQHRVIRGTGEDATRASPDSH